MQDSLTSPLSDSQSLSTPSNYPPLASYLSAIGIPPMGNLDALSPAERQQTFECIEALIQQRQKDVQVRGEYMDKMFLLEQDKRSISRQLELASDKIDVLTGDVGRAENTIRVNASKFKQERDKLASEKDDLKKELAKMIGKEAQFIHEIKKRDGTISKLQDQLRKNIGDCSQNKSSMEALSSPLPPVSAMPISSSVEFAATNKRNYEEVVSNLSEETDKMREALFQLYEGLKTRISIAQKQPGFHEGIHTLNLQEVDFSRVDLIRADNSLVSATQTALQLIDLFLETPQAPSINSDMSDEFAGLTNLKQAKTLISKR